MSVSLITGVTGSQHQQYVQKANARVQAAIANLITGGSSGATDVAALSLGSQLQSQTSVLKQASLSLAQGSSLAQVASGGTTQITAVVQQLTTLAQQAQSPVLNEANRAQLDQQFQALAKQINTIVGSTNFGGKALLDGSVSGDNALSIDSLLQQGGSSDGLSIENLSTSNLFNGASLNVLTAANATQALSVLGNALNKVLTNQASIGSFQQSVDYAAASIDSAIANQEAARSTLTEDDFVKAATEFSLANTGEEAALAIAAQTNRLPPSLLELLVF